MPSLNSLRSRNLDKESEMCQKIDMVGYDVPVYIESENIFSMNLCTQDLTNYSN